MGKSVSLITSLILLILIPKSVDAIESKIEVQTTGDDSSVSIQQDIQSNSSTSYQSTSSNNVSIHQSGGGNNSVKIINNRFTISGKVSESTGSNISVSGQKISIDKSKVANFSQTGNIDIGSQVTVEGLVISGTLYAEKIYSGTPTSSNNPTANPTGSSSPSTTPSSSVNPEVDASVSADIKKVNLSIIQIIGNIFSQIINSLKAVFNDS